MASMLAKIQMESEEAEDEYVSQLEIDMLEAARAGHEDIVARLFALDPSLVDARYASWSQETPLHLAATNGHDGVVAKLLALSPQSGDVRDYNGRTALHLAAENGHDKIVTLLLAHNPALIDAVTSSCQTALHFAACKGHKSTVVQLLNHRPGLLDMKTASNDTALHLAASGGHVKVVAELLARRPSSSSSLAEEDWMVRTPLFCAASKGHQEVVELFPLTTDQVHRRDRNGNTLLHLVVVAKFNPALIQRVCEMNPGALLVGDMYGSTPFDIVIGLVDEWAIEYFQWKLSIWSVEEALAKVMQRNVPHTIEQIKVLQRGEQRFREVVQGESERSLLLSLPRDCVHLIISDYLFRLDSSILDYMSDSTEDISIDNFETEDTTEQEDLWLHH